MNTIVCDFNFGIKDATVYVIKNNMVTEIHDNVPQAPDAFIPALFKIAEAAGCHEVRFNGSDSFVEFYIQQAQKYALKNYTNNDWTFILQERNK